MDERITFLCEIVNRISEIISDKENKKKQGLVKAVYEKTEEVYNDFYRILQYAYLEIDSGNMTVDEAVRYFDHERFPFKSSRKKIRGYMQHPYYSRNQELEWFNIGVMGVLCGGIHDSIERFLNCSIKENDIFAETKVEFKGYHTIVDIMNLYDRKNMNSLFYSDFYKHYLGGEELEEAIRKRLLVDIKRQMGKIDKAWQMVCDYYPRIMF